jgi:hypothetical protein
MVHTTYPIASNADGDMAGSEGTGITVSHDFGLEFATETTTQTKELIITKSSINPPVTFIAARVSSPDDSVAE